MGRPNARYDPSIKCKCCRQRMRYHPTEKSPRQRREPPYAGTCTMCKPGQLHVLDATPRCEKRGCNAIDALGELGRTLP